MNKKTKLIILLLILIVLTFFCKKLLTINTLNYNLEYNGNKFSVKEKYNRDNYFITIKNNKTKYSYRLYNQTANKRRIVNKIYYYRDNDYECLLPIINNKVEYDITCYNGNILYDYNTIIGNNTKLDQFVNTIEEYNVNAFKNDTNKTSNIDTLKYYINNEISNVVAITTYKGLIISGEVINLFDKDIYNNKISTFVDKYYLIADYDQNYEFQYFYLVDLITKDIKKIKSKYEISFDSYIQGIVEDKVYLYDKNNENQYEIDVINKKINIISSNDKIRYYKNKKWEKLNKAKANKEVYFDYQSLDNLFPDYDEVVESKEYYYLFKKNKSYFDLYRVDKSNLDIYKFISVIPTNSIYHKDNYIYYVYKDKLYYYNDNMGLKILLEDSELVFNHTIKYYIY